MLKRFESFEIDNSKIWIVGVPSGEAFQVTREGLDALYKEKLIYYSTKYVQTGFYVFEDEDVDLIKRYVAKKPTDVNIVSAGLKPKKDILIFKNLFNNLVMDSIIAIVNEYPITAELYVQNDCLGITYGEYYIEITLNDNGGRYRLVKRYHADIIDAYAIITDKNLIERVEYEMYHKNPNAL